MVVYCFSAYAGQTQYDLKYVVSLYYTTPMQTTWQKLNP